MTMKITAMNDSWKDMENNAAGSMISIMIPAVEIAEIMSFSFSDMNENIKTAAMTNARCVEDENPEKIA